MSGNFITLESYTYLTDTYVIVAKLESEGIEHVIKNENLLATQQFLSNAVGGVEVQVKESDLERAKQILQLVKSEQAAAEKVPDEMASSYKKVLQYCPSCESTNVFQKKAGFFSFGAKEYLCMDCKFTWKQ